MKNTMIRCIAAWLLAALVALCPMGTLAQTDFSAGDMLPTLWKEALSAGREITLHITAGVDELPDAGEKLPALRALLDALKLEVRLYDDFGTTCMALELNIGEQNVATLYGRMYEDGSQELTTSLLPGKRFVVEAKKWPAQEKLASMADEIFVTYFYILGGWVSETQRWNEDLYVSVDEKHPATQARDEVSQAMQYRVQNIDFLYLLESWAFHFRDNDKALQQALTDVLVEQGVTRGQFRQVVDALFTREELNGPEHWITRTEYLKPEQLQEPVNVEDMYYFATHLAYSVKTCQAEMVEDTTQFLVSEGTDYQTVGFDGTMPQMWGDFPFKNGSFIYNRKTVEDGVHYTADGHMDLIRSGYAVDGTLDFFMGAKSAQSVTDTYDIAMTFGGENAKPGPGSDYGFDFHAEDRKYIEGDNDVDEITATLALHADEVTLEETEVGVKSSTWEVDADFANETSISLRVGERLSAGVQIEMASGDYRETEWPEETVYISQLTIEEAEALENDLLPGVIQAMSTLVGAMPAEAMALFN